MNEPPGQAWVFTLTALAGVAVFGYAIRGPGHGGRIGALVIYLLVVNALAFVAPPLQQIPACV